MTQLVPALIKEPAQIQLIKVEEEVGHGHPKDSIVSPDLVFCRFSGLRVLVNLSLPLLSPVLGVVTPGSLPLGFGAPRISQLNEFLAVDFRGIHN